MYFTYVFFHIKLAKFVDLNNIDHPKFLLKFCLPVMINRALFHLKEPYQLLEGGSAVPFSTPRPTQDALPTWPGLCCLFQSRLGLSLLGRAQGGGVGGQPERDYQQIGGQQEISRLYLLLPLA